jgi:hypothetical protein
MRPRVLGAARPRRRAVRLSACADAPFRGRSACDARRS